MISRTGNTQRAACSVQRAAIRKCLSANRYLLSAKNGLTLIEVLIAVAILAFGIVGVLRAYAGSMATLEAGQFNIDATHLLNQKMADVQQKILEDGPGISSGGSGNFDGYFTDFLWEWKISPTDTDDLNELTVVVSHNYNPRTFTLKTYVVDEMEEEEE